VNDINTIIEKNVLFVRERGEDNLPSSGSRKTHPAFNVYDGQCQRSTPNIDMLTLESAGKGANKK